MKRTLLTRALSRPDSLIGIKPADWELVVCQARRAGLLARIHLLLAERRLLQYVPVGPRMHLEAACVVAENEQRIVRWEVKRIQRALAPTGVPIILLKGAAYLLAGLPNARGRISSDVDILVPKEQLDAVEKALLQHGWEHVKLEDYDQHYYRAWAHELPPLRHRERHTVADVHHNILAVTGRLCPDARKLIQAAAPLEKDNLKVLAPADMVLHSAVHLFQDGDLQSPVRELVDLDDLIRHFAKQHSFGRELLERAIELNLTRPLFYALRYSRRILQTPIPENLLKGSENWRPAWPGCALMDKLVGSAVRSSTTRRAGAWEALSLALLFIRSQWLRMPPWLLARHLGRKAVRQCGWLAAAGTHAKI